MALYDATTRALLAASDDPDVAGEEALAMGLVWKVCEPDDLLTQTYHYANVLAAKPISSLIAVKTTMVAPLRPQIDAARERENAYFAQLMGAQANADALSTFIGREG